MGYTYGVLEICVFPSVHETKGGVCHPVPSFPPRRERSGVVVTV